MATDATRAAFIKNEYRWSTATDAAVKGRDTSAQSIDIEANVDATTAASLASTILAQNNTARVFALLVDGVMTPDDFVGGVPRYILDATTFQTDGRTQRAMTFACDLNTGTTQIKVHG